MGFSQIIGWKEKVEARQQEFGVVQAQLNNLVQKQEKKIKKLNILTKGYRLKVNEMRERILKCTNELATTDTNIEIFKYLHSNERTAIPRRIAELEKMVSIERGREAQLQEKYRKLLDEAETLEQILKDLGPKPISES